ncbi:hypothetical protein SAY86_016778 [Trapa natans]|uniref:Uncharacterized protein n=1 Tax=Trapa natans TaxID=22666 RepID=A0AAN7LQB4_TRANT|nr:hypothetical protein SAY86_016778 [Trapa natans]
MASSSGYEEMEGGPNKKQKLDKFFERLMKKVLEKQESLQRQFVVVLEKYEQDRKFADQSPVVKISENTATVAIETVDYNHISANTNSVDHEEEKQEHQETEKVNGGSENDDHEVE